MHGISACMVLALLSQEAASPGVRAAVRVSVTSRTADAQTRRGHRARVAGRAWSSRAQLHGRRTSLDRTETAPCMPSQSRQRWPA